MIDHCVSALIVLNEEEIYKAYVTNALKALVFNTAGQDTRQTLKFTYTELIDRTPKDERSAEEVVNHVLGKLMEVQNEPNDTGGKDIP